MSSLSNIWVKVEVLETLLKTVKAKGDKGVGISISINDESNDYGQNVYTFVQQSKEDREAKKERYFTGSGGVVWHDGKIVKAEKKGESNNQANNTPSQQSLPDLAVDDLPF